MKKLAKKVDRSTLSSISTPPSNVKALATDAAHSFFIFKELLQGMFRLSLVFLCYKEWLGIRPGRPHHLRWSLSDWRALVVRKEFHLSSEPSPFKSIQGWFQLAESRNQFCGRQQANWLGALWFPWTRYCFDPNNELISQIGFSSFEEAFRVGHPCPEFAEVMPSLGRLGQSIEGGGKRRIFAIGNWVIPRVLHPLHKWCMTVLSTLPMDGTFNQTAPVERLIYNVLCRS